MLPRIIIVKAVSVDGRTDGFERDLELESQVYRQMSRSTAFFTDPDSMNSFINMLPEEVFNLPPLELDGHPDPRAMLVLCDPEGRVDNWDTIMKVQMWNKRMVLVTDSTPSEYTEELKKRSILYIKAGKDRLEVINALEELYEGHDIHCLTLDSAGAFNGELIKGGFVDEISLMIYPAVVGGDGHFLNVDRLVDGGGSVKLKLIKEDLIEEKQMWLRYMVIRTSPKPGTYADDDVERVRKLLADINSGKELLEHDGEILGFIENTFILISSTIKGLEGMSLSPDEVMERIVGLMERGDAIQKDIDREIKRITELPQGDFAVEYFNRALQERMDAYGEAVQEQLKKLGVDPQNM